MTSDHLDRLARGYGPRHSRLYEALDESLEPRGPEMLVDVAAEYLRPQSRILDIGCRDAKYLIRLVQAHGCRGVGFDPVDWHVESARAAVDEAGVGDRIRITNGVIEQIEEPDDHFDFIWCRDVLVLVQGLERGLAEAARVLKADGAMLVYTNFATELLEPGAAPVYGPIGTVPRNFDEATMEAAFDGAGLVVERKDVIGTEWREHEEERTQPVSRSLLRLARLRRRRDAIVEEYGQELYDLAEAALQWTTYQFLGKLRPMMYVLRRRS